MSYSLLMQSDSGNGAFAGVVWLFWLVVGVLMIVATWKIFTKAGQPGWASIIPIYNWLVFLRIIGRPWWWLLLLLVPVVGFVLLIIMMINLAESFGRGVGFAIGLIIFPTIWLLILGFGSSKYVGRAAGPTVLPQLA